MAGKRLIRECSSQLINLNAVIMKRVHRVNKVKDLLAKHRVVSRSRLEVLLDVSRSTLSRDISELRNELGIDLIYDRRRRVYHLNK